MVPQASYQKFGGGGWERKREECDFVSKMKRFLVYYLIGVVSTYCKCSFYYLHRVWWCFKYCLIVFMILRIVYQMVDYLWILKYKITSNKINFDV